MDKETYEALKALLVYVGTNGIESKNKGIIGARNRVQGWIEEVAKDYEEESEFSKFRHDMAERANESK